MKKLLVIPFLLGNSAGSGGMLLEGLLALIVVFGLFGLVCWGVVKIIEKIYE